jgi:FtsP/CotA-like multicopper oxidase with cupredoxin domain
MEERERLEEQRANPASQDQLAASPTPGARRTRWALALLSAIVASGLGLIALAHVLDDFGPPPPGDPSELTGPIIGEDEAIDDLELLDPANEGAFEGGATGTSEDPGENNALGENEVDSDREFDVPTGGPPSPLFGAGEFEQQMLRFEEFGSEELADAPALTAPFPSPTTGPAPYQDPIDVEASGPSPAALETFLDQPGISPFPTEYANDIDSNPWDDEIETFLGRALSTPPAEGRPPGKGWAHQRWNEFHPQVFFNTVQAGARENGGARDDRQLHDYTAGEFGPGGLYYRVYDPDDIHNNGNEIVGTTDGVEVRFHPDLPIQDHKAVWTFDGTFPPKLAIARYGEAILMRHYNGLPVDPSANRGFGLHTITTHEHNGHNPAESDGFTNAFFFPGQFYDYRWPLQLAGYDTINTEAEDPLAAYPCAPGETLFVHDEDEGVKTCDANGRIQIRGDWRETMSTHWFHDHMLDFTAQNVYKGNAVMFNYYSALDRGNEAHDDGVNLRLPSGTALPWGNRDYDVNLLLADKAWDETGQLWFNIFNLDGFVGDRLLTNWLYKPYFEVRARRYRFRILNASVSRYFAIALVKQVAGSGGQLDGPPGSGVSYDRVGFHMVANDGNIMEHAVPFDGSVDLDGDANAAEHKGLLPTIGIAERYDIVVDFASQGIEPGDKLYLVNVLEHQDGQLAGDSVSLQTILDGSYEGQGFSGGDPRFDSAVGRFLEFRVVSYSGTDLSMDPHDFEPGGLKMIPLAIDRNDPQIDNALHRTFRFRDDSSDETPWVIRTDGGERVGMDPRRLSAAPRLATGPTQAGFDGVGANGYDSLGTMEVWLLEGNDNWSHPVHVHFEEGVILTRDGAPPPAWETWARKDVYRLGPREDSGEAVEFAIRFREFAGTFMEHCHNTQHEDHAMLLRWDIEHPGQTKLMPAPIPTWDGVEYVDSAALPTFRTGDGFGPQESLGGSGPVIPGGGGGGFDDADGGGSTVTITTARYRVNDGELRVEGTVAGATSVTLRDGAISGGRCKGKEIATTDVGRGTFLWRAEGLDPVPTRVCVSTPGGAVSAAQVQRIE